MCSSLDYIFSVLIKIHENFFFLRSNFSYGRPCSVILKNRCPVCAKRGEAIVQMQQLGFFLKNNMVHVTAYTNYVYLSWHVYTRNFLGIATLGCWHKRIQRNIHVRRRDWRLLLFVECCSQVQYERYTFSKLDLGSSSFIISLVVCGIIVTALELASNCVLTSQTTPVYVYAYWLIYFYTNFTTVLWVTDCHLLANASEKLIDRLLVSRVNERTYQCTWKYIGKIHMTYYVSYITDYCTACRLTEAYLKRYCKPCWKVQNHLSDVKTGR